MRTSNTFRMHAAEIRRVQALEAMEDLSERWCLRVTAARRVRAYTGFGACLFSMAV